MNIKEILATSLDAYMRQRHNQDECAGFIHGFEEAFRQRDAIKSACEHTVDDLMFKNDSRAKCRCGAEWHYD